MFHANFLDFALKIVEHSRYLLQTLHPLMVIDLNVRRNQPQCSNFALNIRTRQSHCGSCRSKGGRCRGTNGNSSYIFSAEKCTFIIKYSKAWKWCRTFSANFFDLNVRHLTCLRSFCVEHSGQLPLDRFGSGSFKARSRNLSCIFCLKNDIY